MKVILAEKPVLQRDIANAIPGQGQIEGSVIKKGEYVIICAFGHLLSLKEPQDYNESYKQWNLAQLPIFFENWEKKISVKATQKGQTSIADQVKLIQYYVSQADEVIHAGDMDDEGQLLIDELLEWCHYTGPVKRLNTVDNGREALSFSLAHLEDNAKYATWGKAANARSISDLAVGVNLTRYFTCCNPDALITIGRVQTPTLGLVVKRDSLIEGHKSIIYYTVHGTVLINGAIIPVTYVPDANDPNLDDGRITNRAYAEQLVQQLTQVPTYDVVISKRKVEEQPPLPFNKTKLSLYAERNWGYDPAQTLQITQALRENYKAITYNRTDCQYLFENQHAEAPKVMQCVVQNIRFCPKTLDINIKSKAFNDKIVKSTAEAHTAIIPQPVNLDLSKMKSDERNVYLAICKYYMAQFMPPAQKIQTTVSADCPFGGKLQNSASVIIDPGYRVIFREAEPEPTSPLNDLAEGVTASNFTNGEIKEGHTSPPARFTLAGLENAMASIAKYVDDPKAKDLLRQKDAGKKDENGSIGTVATRAAIIQNLMDRGYIEFTGKGKQIRSTALGREMCRVLPKELTEPELTAIWWTVQEDIKMGLATQEDLTARVLQDITRILHGSYPHINMDVVPDKYKRNGAKEPLGICPACGAPVVEGKKSYGCTNWKNGCKFAIWKSSNRPMLKGVNITAKDAKKFLAGEPVRKTKLKKKDGGTFDAYLRMSYDPNSPYGAELNPDFSIATPKSKKKTSSNKSGASAHGQSWSFSTEEEAWAFMKAHQTHK